MRYLLALFLVGCGSTASAPAPTADAGTVYEVIAAPVTFVSGNTGSASAFCRSATDTIIAGGCLISEQRRIDGVAITGSYPDHDLSSPDRWTCHASNTSGFDVSLTATAICETRD